jgi:soluble lytic murein transglycosylase-like protein
MTKKYFIVAILQFIILISFYFMGYFDANCDIDTLQTKNKLLRKAIMNQQWEVDQAHSRNQELDALRWQWQQTKLQHADWTLIAETVYRKSKEYNLRPELVLAVMHRESYFNPLAYSNKGAMGLMQINFDVWSEMLGLSEISILDIEINIDAGCKILRIYLDANGGDETKALLWYWAGANPPDKSYLDRIHSSKYYKGAVQ